MPVKIVHAADFHLDAPFSSLSRAAAVRRRQEQREAVAALVRACNEAQCDVMLLARDLNGRRIYDNINELKAALNVNEIITAEQYEKGLEKAKMLTVQKYSKIEYDESLRNKENEN